MISRRSASPLAILALALAPSACASSTTVVAQPVEVVAAPPAEPPAPPPEPKKIEAPAKDEAAKPPTPAQERDAAEFGMIGLYKAPAGENEAKGNTGGDSIGDSFGAGGLGLSGVGNGAQGGIGIGTLGLGHGSGSGRLQGFGGAGTRWAKPPQIRMGVTKVTGRLPPEVIQRIVRQNFGRFRLCYENGLKSNMKLAGQVNVRFVIARDGAIKTVTKESATLTDGNVVNCVVRAFYGLSFPQPEGGEVTVIYPIAFSPGEPAPAAAPAKKP